MRPFLVRNQVLVGMILTLVGACRADVVSNLLAPTLNAAPGITVEFSGTLTNTGAADVFLNGDVSVLPYATLTLDDSPFFANAPLFLAGGGSYTGPFFDVLVSSTAAPGIYTGSFTAQGGASSSSFDNLASQEFQVDVTNAGVILNLIPPRLSVAPGATAAFTGTLTNAGAADVFLNGDISVLPYTTLTLDDSPFFANAPLFLAPGGSYTGPFFDVLVDSTAAPGIYTGSFTAQGGADSSSFSNLASQSFQVGVTNAVAVPEPNSAMFTATILLTIVLARSRLRRT